MGQPHDNPTLSSAEHATGLSPLNTQPPTPQPPQIHTSHNPTPPAPLTTLPSPPFTPLVLPLEPTETRTKTPASVSPSTYPSASQFEDLLKGAARPEGPARAAEVAVREVEWPAGFEGVEGVVRDVVDEGAVRAFEVATGVGKGEVCVVGLELGGERVLGVQFGKE